VSISVIGTSTVMPNHVHATVRLADDILLRDVLHSWKSYTAKVANRILGRNGVFWHEESYDRLIRSSEELARRNEYILQNPLKAGNHESKWTRSYDARLFDCDEMDARN
jgi:REP element-mobilizing transposase RayT